MTRILIFSGRHDLHGKRTVGFFSLALRVARFARVRLLRHALPISLLILRKKPTVLQSTSFETKWTKTGCYHKSEVLQIKPMTEGYNDRNL